MKCSSKHFCIMCCIVSVIVIALPGAVSSVHAQTTSTGPAFEVATIKPAVPFDPSKFGQRINLARVTYTYQSVKDLMQETYRLKRTQISGPESITSEKYDIVATLPKGAAK